MDTDEKFMKQAIRLAKKGLSSTSPNPAVGALLVKDGRVVSKGYHKKAGGPHAEIVALEEAGDKAKGATLYVTLEPCNHYGRTPPCTKSIIEKSVKKVVVGMIDPNPHVMGGGCRFLLSKGVDVVSGVLENDCQRLNEAYVKYVTKDRPFVILKSALTLDGWIATHTGDSKWITNEKSRKFVHTLRSKVDAILVGVETAISDNPHLSPYLIKKPKKNPLKIVVDTNLRISLESHLLNPETSALTIVAAGDNADTKKKKDIENLGASVLCCRTRNNRVDLSCLMDKLADMSISSVLVEGGSKIFSAMINGGLVDKFYIFLAPKLLLGNNGVPFLTGPGSDTIKNCLSLHIEAVRRFDDDIMIEAYPGRLSDNGFTARSSESFEGRAARPNGCRCSSSLY